MSNAVFGWPIYSDIGPTYAPTLSSGSWLTTLPLTNSQDRRLQKVARTTDVVSASTKLIVDLGVARSVGLLAVFIPNITKTTTPTVQWHAGTTSGAADVYAPAAQSYWPAGVALEDVTGVDGSVMNVWSVLVPATPQTARYWELDIVDTANADGFLDVARIVIAGAFQPSVNVSDGDRTGHESETIRTVTDGGAALYNAKRRRRTDVFSINDLTNTESFASVRKMQRQLGTSGQVFWVPDPSDATYGWERNYLGVLRELSPLQSGSSRWNTSWSIVEEL